MKLSLSVKETAHFLGINPSRVRIGIQRNIYPFGVAIPSKNGINFSYYIPKKEVEEYLGIKYEDFLKGKVCSNERETAGE